MTAERVDQLRALPDQKIPRPEQHGARLLSLGLNRDKAHRRSTRSLSDRFRVSCIVLLALDERFDIGGRDQANLMPEVPDGSPPVVRTPAGFQGDDAARLLGKEGENFFSGKLFAEPNAAVGKSAMRLEGPLCKIKTDNANLFHGCSLRSWDAKTSPPWHIAMPSGGASTPSSIARARQPTADLIGEVLAELQRPLSYSLVTDDDAACGQHLLDHAQAEREAKVEPDGVADDLGREAVAGIAGANGRPHPVRLPAPLSIRKLLSAKLTVPPCQMRPVSQGTRRNALS